uniref:Putative ovule protein n=1 Tax=Solanum chacoense TaxID=4108 RepID=A0A0V0HTM1_SOLCH
MKSDQYLGGANRCLAARHVLLSLCMFAEQQNLSPKSLREVLNGCPFSGTGKFNWVLQFFFHMQFSIKCSALK